MNFKQQIFFIGVLAAGFFLVLFTESCQKTEQFIEGKTELKFSEDTILFDTLFTTIGSSTYYLLVSNVEDRPVNISNIFLAEGENSMFRMNVDGQSGHHIRGVEIPAHDSIYIFVEVTIDPNSETGPMLVTDSIIFNINGYLQDVDLIAYGRNAHFILPNLHIEGLPPINIVAEENTDVIWTNEKPIVIYGYAVVDSTATLRIEEGTEIYFHNGGGLWIYKGGCLKVMGTKDNPVTFQGDRPEDYYKDLPGQWDRIWINEGSTDNEINYAEIRNAFIGIQAELLQQNMGNKLSIKNTIIENMSGVGILSRAYSIDAENLLINNCKQYCLALTMGGSYEFRHSTIANYWNYDIRETPSVYINNYFKDANDVVYPFDINRAHFFNTIIYGNIEEELILDNHSEGGDFNYLFDHALLKTQNETTDESVWKSILKNQDPAFEDYLNHDFHLKSESPAIESGKGGISPTNDLDGVSRDPNAPDLGTYEYVN